MSDTVKDHRALGDNIVSRLKKTAVPNQAKAEAKVFIGVHASFDKEAARADAARTKRDEALLAIHDRDGALDSSVDRLAEKMIGAGLGTRTKPFGKFIAITPSELKALAYVKEVKQVRILVRKIAKSAPPESVSLVLKEVTANADKVMVAVVSLREPQSEYSKALSRRDALLPDWGRALNRFKVKAAAAWIDDPAITKDLFSAPAAVDVPVTRRPKKKTANPPEEKGT